MNITTTLCVNPSTLWETRRSTFAQGENRGLQSAEIADAYTMAMSLCIIRTLQPLPHFPLTTLHKQNTSHSSLNAILAQALSETDNLIYIYVQ